MKIGYKGLTKDLTATQGSVKEQFQVGQVYTKILPPDRPLPRVCTSDGYHYCNELKEVFRYYPIDGNNRYFKIEVLGSFQDSGTKSITTSFKLLEEISKEEIEDRRYEENLNLELVADIQKQYPMFHVGGSVGLFLHGVRLKRWLKSSSSDLDFVSPYFVLPEKKFKASDGEELEVEHRDAKASGNDFDETFFIGSTKIDYKIDPKQRYELIEYKGVTYKVSNLMTILEAKLRYALKPEGRKHKEDITEMVVSKKKEGKQPELDVILPF